MIVAGVSILPIGRISPSVSRYLAAAAKEFETSGLKCTLGPIGTTAGTKTPEEVYAALARAQAAVFEIGVERAYTAVKKTNGMMWKAALPGIWYVRFARTRSSGN